MIYSGTAQQGPKHGKTIVDQSRRVEDEGGFYVYMPARGPVPSRWKWVVAKEKTDGR